jgi:putative methionine-R-sulfoxide reductase with GAF domain
MHDRSQDGNSSKWRQDLDRPNELVQDQEHAACSLDASFVLTWEEIANLAAEPGKPAETLMNVVALIARRFGADVCSAYLLEPDRANLVLAATLGLRRECVGKLRMAVNEGLVGLVAEQVRPVAVEQVTNHPRFKYFSEAGEDAYQSFLGVPLIDRGVLQGVLVIQTVQARVFPEDEIRSVHGGRKPGGAHRERSPHPRPFHRACPGAALGAGPQYVVELGSRFLRLVPRSRSAALESAQSQSGLFAERVSARQTRSARR